jgi:hypothetical protein
MVPNEEERGMRTEQKLQNRWSIHIPAWSIGWGTMDECSLCDGKHTTDSYPLLANRFNVELWAVGGFVRVDFSKTMSAHKICVLCDGAH